ncbi:MAG: cob(I)yrinic acid a,c-diamide adenosyltransferase [Clostridia bacterium]|nr:cob(I)yrinic acid a,c-diamide adenosyltransferase [Clostridia bacterium]MDR3643886.1 cob(I)yrinic acid a,c-diamide adenosyltransferase [Clostridia bacterium]
MENSGCIQIYMGDGKGKTTAAVGLAVRAAGSGMKVLFCQFLKGRQTGEIAPLEQLGVTVLRTGGVKKFIPGMTEEEKRECAAEQRACFDRMRAHMGEFGLIVLDEVLGAIETGMLSCAEVAALCREKPAAAELVLTGRISPRELLEAADYVSEIRCVRHPYEKGLGARKGIEY